jgi:hypothetical protein
MTRIHLRKAVSEPHTEMKRKQGGPEWKTVPGFGVDTWTRRTTVLSRPAGRQCCPRVPARFSWTSARGSRGLKIAEMTLDEGDIRTCGLQNRLREWPSGQCGLVRRGTWSGSREEADPGVMVTRPLPGRGRQPAAFCGLCGSLSLESVLTPSINKDLRLLMDLEL